MFDVAWIQSALDDLANVWMNADSATRARVNTAVEHLEAHLQVDPLAISESRDPGEWVCFVEPLGALLEIDENKHIVWILGIWHFE